MSRRSSSSRGNYPLGAFGLLATPTYPTALIRTMAGASIVRPVAGATDTRTAQQQAQQAVVAKVEAAAVPDSTSPGLSKKHMVIGGAVIVAALLLLRR